MVLVHAPQTCMKRLLHAYSALSNSYQELNHCSLRHENISNFSNAVITEFLFLDMIHFVIYFGE